LTAQALRIIDVFYSFFGLLEKSSGSRLSRIDGDEDEVLVTKNNVEMALEQ